MGETFISPGIKKMCLTYKMLHFNLEKPVLVIRKITEEILKLDLEKYCLTFDSGLFDHYFYWEELKKIDTPKIFYIISGAIDPSLVCRERFGGTFKDSLSEKESLELWDDKEDQSNFMNLGELRHIAEEGAIIGAHSHWHLERYGSDCFLHFLADFELDCKEMHEWFMKYLPNHYPKKYACPYDRQYTAMDAVLLNNTDIEKIEFGNSIQKIEGTRYSQIYRKNVECLI